VKIWDSSSARNLIGLNGDQLHALWVDGVESPGKQENILAGLNRSCAEEVLKVVIVIQVWGQQAQFNVNDIEVSEGT
jgi:hypothetical protein